MSQFNSPAPRRTGGDLDVYTGLLAAALLVLASGVFMMATLNMRHSESRAGAGDGGMFTLVKATR